MSESSIKKDQDYCTYCPKMCHFSCPVAEAEKNEASTPWGKQQTAKLIREKVLPLTVENARVAYKCVTCRTSQSFCNHEIAVNDSLQDLRERAVESNKAPPEIYAFAKKFSTHNNPYGRDLQAKLLNLVPSSWLDAKKPGVFFPSCHTIALNSQAIDEYLKLFIKLKINDLRVFSDSMQCCGYSLLNLGFRDEFKDIAHVQYHTLKSAQWIVVGSPECAWAFKEVYPQYGFRLKAKILTLSEYVGGYLKNFAFRSKPKTRARYFYHDSCYMGRYLKQYQEPRDLLEMVTGFPPEEFSWNRGESLCSGAGGGYSLIDPQASFSITQRYREEIHRRGVKTIVTACSKAGQRFKELGQNIRVKDLVSFLNENLLKRE